MALAARLAVERGRPGLLWGAMRTGMSLTSGRGRVERPCASGGLLAGLALALALVLAPVGARAAPFDLAGPKLEIRVTRGSRTLPIGEVPSLAPGDQLLIKADLPAGQSARYILVAAFLRGATDPPPQTWFSRTATWTPSGRNGLRVTVPEGAQQGLVFLAPQTGGDFTTLVGAVRGRPGAFVRASQELTQASLDRSRLDAFLAGIARINQSDPTRLKAASPLLARSLGIKIDTACLQKVSEFQASCLTQDRDALVLDDARKASRLADLASGYSAELVRELSSTPWAGAGNYSPYVASMLDIVHLLDSTRTAQYQYIPALTTEADDQVSLFLNAPPSFRNPKSVLVAALPPVQPSQPPALHPVDPGAAYCASRPEPVLPVEGSPLLYATRYAHDLVIRLRGKDGKPLDLPVRADAERGGLVVDTGPAASAPLPAGPVDGQLVGAWGFGPYAGPTFRFVAASPQAWAAKDADRPGLIAGQDTTVRLHGQESACVESVRLQQASGAEAPLDWASAGDELTVHVPASLAAGDQLLIKTFGRKEADVVRLGRYGPMPQIAGFEVHAGDQGGVLTGARLETVRGVTLAGVAFAPLAGAPVSDGRMELQAEDGGALAGLQPGQTATGVIALKDGRNLPLQTTVGPVRPRVTLMSKAIERPEEAVGLPIKLGGQDDAPRRARLTFSVQAEAPLVFTGRETLEITTANGAFTASLNAADGLTLQDPHVAVASLDLDKKFAASAFGPLRFRLVFDGEATEWRPLVTLVRLPEVHGVSCPSKASAPCQLKGANLFLIASLSRDASFDHPQTVPDGFPGDVLPAPRPAGGRLYLKLRDDPGAVDTLVVAGGGDARKARASSSAAESAAAE